jgi:hypothetical protein
MDMDFSPMRPDAWAKADAQRWHEYYQYLSAYEEGRDKVKHRRGNKKKADSKMADLVKKVHG